MGRYYSGDMDTKEILNYLSKLAGKEGFISQEAVLEFASLGSDLYLEIARELLNLNIDIIDAENVETVDIDVFYKDNDDFIVKKLLEMSIENSNQKFSKDDIKEFFASNTKIILKIEQIQLEKLIVSLGSMIGNWSPYDVSYYSLFIISMLLYVGIDINTTIKGQKLIEYFFNKWRHEHIGPNYSDKIEFNSNDKLAGYYHELINVLFRNHPNLDFWDIYDHDYLDESNYSNSFDDDEMDDDEMDDDEMDDDEYDSEWDDEEKWVEIKTIRKIKKPFIENYFGNFVHQEKLDYEVFPNYIVRIVPQGFVSVVDAEIEGAKKLILSMGIDLKPNQMIDVVLNNKVIKSVKVLSDPFTMKAKEYQDKVKFKKNFIYIHPDYEK